MTPTHVKATQSSPLSLAMFSPDSAFVLRTLFLRYSPLTCSVFINYYSSFIEVVIVND